jgi:alpha/beta superfamily hydrolase
LNKLGEENMIKTFITIAVMVLIMPSCLLFADRTDGKSQDVPINYDLLIPSAMDKVACVVICSGQGYHKDRPLLLEFAREAEKMGIASLRFNWSYFTAGENPSADGSREMADISAMLQLVKNHPAIDSTRIYIAGKSMGSLFAYYAFQEHPELKGCLLLTPLLSKTEEGNNYYPDLAKETRPVAFILGDRDSAMCNLTELYKYLGNCSQNISVVALAGGHGIQIEGGDETPETRQINELSIRLAAELAAYRLKVFEYDLFKNNQY